MPEEGYRFIDDLYVNSIFDEQSICRAANYIIEQKEKEDLAEKQAKFGKAYKELIQWQYLEDKEIREYISMLSSEINNDEYLPKQYQNIISLLIVMEREGYCDKEFILNVCKQLESQVQKMKESVDMENYQQFFSDDEGSLDLFHEYYDPVYSAIVSKNMELDKEEVNGGIDYSTGESFKKYCQDEKDSFPEKGSFITYIDLKKIETLICKGKIKDIYDISSGFRSIYHFGNLSEYYYKDVKQLKEFVKKLEKINDEIEGNTRKIAINNLITTLESKIEKM